MDVSERLSPEQLEAADYLAASHLHRYALAAELCAGLRVVDLGCGIGYGSAMLATGAASVTGVDVDEAVVAQAQRQHEAVTFVAGDALAFLRRAEPADLDAVVMFEALEHVPDVEAVLEQLLRLAQAGVKLVVSVPNSRAFHEDNPFHLTDFGIDEARRAFAPFDGAEWLHQWYAEGSLLLPEAAASGDGLDARVARLEQADPEYANTFVVTVGFATGAAAQASAQLNLVATPAYNRYMLELERANAELWRMNRLLQREVYGKHDAAAASASAAAHERIRELETRSWILGEEKRQAEERLALERGWSYAPHHHALDRVVQRAKRVPGLARAVRTARSRLRH